MEVRGHSGELGLLTGSQTQRAWPRSQLTSSGGSSQNCIDLMSGQQGGVYMLFLTQGWPACLALQSIPAPHLTWLDPWGVVSDNFLRFDLTSQNLVSFEVGQFFGSIVICTASQAGDSFQPWLTFAFWPSGSVRFQALYPICNGESDNLLLHMFTEIYKPLKHQENLVKNFVQRSTRLHRQVVFCKPNGSSSIFSHHMIISVLLKGLLT